MKIINDHPTKCLRVVSVIPGMPAWKAGIRTGDEIIAVNDKPVSDLEKKASLELSVLPFSALIKRGHQVLEFFVKE